MLKIRDEQNSDNNRVVVPLLNLDFIEEENEEIENVKKTIGESKISERETNVVVKDRSAPRPVPQREAKNKKNVIPTLGGNDTRTQGGTTTIIHMK